MLKQDTELIQKMLVNTAMPRDGSEISDISTINKNIPIGNNSLEIINDGYQLIRDDAIGDMLIKDLEKEAVIRTLKYFNNNRRKTAKSLGMSERTLYRKIDEFELEPKIKK